PIALTASEKVFLIFPTTSLITSRALITGAVIHSRTFANAGPNVPRSQSATDRKWSRIRPITLDTICREAFITLENSVLTNDTPLLNEVRRNVTNLEIGRAHV